MDQEKQAGGFESMRALTGLFPAFLGKGPWPKLGKNDQLKSKIGRY